MKKAISLLLVMCMLITLVPAMAFALEEDAAEPVEDAAAVSTEKSTGKDSNLQSLIKAKLYVKANKAAGLEGNVYISFKPLTCDGTLYLPGSADTSKLFLAWDDAALKVSKNGVEYESGTAPIAPETGTSIYTISRGSLSFNIKITTVKGSADVAGLFLNIDESMGTIDAMNSDKLHETECFGSVDFDGQNNYISMKGRGNSTWVFEKKPYNITFYKKADYDSKKKVELIDGVKSKKWSLLANYLDSTLLRNKVAFDLAQQLGIGLDSRFVDVWMNGEYLGNYLLTPKKDYNVADDGFILENDHIDEPENPEQFVFPNIAEMPLKHNRLCVDDIGDDAVEAGVDVAWIKDYFTEAWNTVLDLDSEEYQEYFDIDSWAKMYLMFEISKTYDCYAGNIIMHRDGLTPEDKLIAGPVWDYDVAFGRTLHKFFVGMLENNQINAEGWYNDSVGFIASDEPYSILQGLGMHESFMQRVTEIYNEYKWAFEAVAGDVDEQRAVIEKSAAMDGVRWGVNHLGGDYTVAPTAMKLLGTGKYRLNYEITLTWDNYVNNLKEYCTKRVMWMSDHLYAEAPDGYITAKLNQQSGTVVLKAVLTAGNQDNSYQWQSSSNGKSWTGISGATGASLKLEGAGIPDGTLYRCIVKNAGCDILTSHCGRTKAYAKTILEPVALDVSTGIEVSDAELQNGELTLVMNGEELGEFTFEQLDNGWSICNSAGKYLAADGSKLVLRAEPFAWSFDNGVFSAAVKVSYTHLGKWLGISHTETAYLALDGAKLKVSMDGGAQAAFRLTTEYLIIKAE